MIDILKLLNPRNLHSLYYYSKGLMSLADKKYHQSIIYFNKSMKFNRVVLHIMSCKKYIGIAYCLKLDYKHAKTFLEEVDTFFSDKSTPDSELYWALGAVYYSEQNYTKAQIYYERALKYYKKNDLTDIRLVKSRLYKIKNTIF